MKFSFFKKYLKVINECKGIGFLLFMQRENGIYFLFFSKFVIVGSREMNVSNYLSQFYQNGNFQGVENFVYCVLSFRIVCVQDRCLIIISWINGIGIGSQRNK